MEYGSDIFSMAFTVKLQRFMSPAIDVSPLRYSSDYAQQMENDRGVAETTILIDNNNYNNNNNNNNYYYNNNINYNNMANQSSFEFSDYELFYRHSVTLTAVYCVAYIIVFIVGLIGNSFVIAVVLRSPRMHTVTNFFIVNLAVADILVIVFCLPATLMSNIYVPWVLGWLMCKVVPYVQGVSVAASVYSLCAVSLDRFLAIWWPLKLQISRGRAKIIIICIWIIALCSTIPWALFFKLTPIYPELPDIMLCIEIWPSGLSGSLYFLLANLIACYILPMVLISLCYVLIWIKVWNRSIPGDSKDTQMDRMQQKSKVKVVKMLVAVVILFVLSWLPLYIIFARIKFSKVLDSREEEFLEIATPVAQWLGSSNSCINPILYAFFNKKYRRGFAEIVRSRSCCSRLRYYDNVAIASSSTSTRKSSHYHNKKAPYSPSIKSEAVSYIYEQNNNNSSSNTSNSNSSNNNSNNNNNNSKKHSAVTKQDSNLSTQMLLKQDSNVSRQSILLKQDSNGSRQMLIKQDSCGSVTRQDSNVSRQLLLLKQDSNGSSKNMLTKQDSQISYIGTRKGQIMRQHSDLSINKRDTLVKQDSTISYIEPRKGVLCKQDTQISYIESKKNSLCRQDSVVSFIEPKKHQLVKQDSVVSFAEPNSEPIRYYQLVKQDSVISFVEHRRSYLTKQDSIIQYPSILNNRNGDGSHSHHVSILKKTDSQNSNSPRRNIEFLD